MKTLFLTIALALSYAVSAQTIGFWTMIPNDKIKFDSTTNEYYINHGRWSYNGRRSWPFITE